MYKMLRVQNYGFSVIRASEETKGCHLWSLEKRSYARLYDIQQAHPIRKGDPFISLRHDVTSVTWHTGT